MFDGLCKPRFYTKCKYLVKITKTRVETVRRKKNSVCKFLKKDIVDLLNNSLDYNAYGRAEGLIEEKRRLCCYELLEQFCVCVASNVSLLQKSSKCPEECREAIASLVYAAARVSEVPELRDLRSLFADRFGTNSLEQFVNPEFVERFKTEAPSKEMKVELLQEIATEYSIIWDAKSLVQRLYTPPPTHHHHAEQPRTKQDKANDPQKTVESLSFHGRKDSLDDESTRRSEEGDRFIIMPAAPYNKPKMEKQESKSDLMPESTSAGRPKPRSVRRRLANQPPAEDSVSNSSKNMRTESMEKEGGEGIKKMTRRTASWQPNVLDFDEVAARVDALTRN